MIMKNIPKVIAVCGGMHSGKSEVTKILQHLLPDHKIDMFAYPLKTYISALTGDNIEKLENNSYKSEKHSLLNIAPREAMTKLGKFTMENYQPNVFIDALFKRNSDNKVIITDLRMPEELEMIKKHGGYIIKIIRYFDLRFPSLKEFVHPANRYNFNDVALMFDHPTLYERLIHYTENQIESIESDITIENNGTLEELVQKVKNIWI